VQVHAGNKRVPAVLEAVGAAGWAAGPEAQKNIAALFLTRTAQEWEDLAEQVGTECAVCRTSEEWLHDRHARESGTVIEVSDPRYGRMLQPGVQVRMSRTPGSVRGPAPRLDADRDPILAELAGADGRNGAAASDEKALRSALEGIKVLDLCIILAGPTCGRTLAEFGADVIKIDRADRGGPGGGGGMASFHIDVNRGKRSILLDLKQPEGLDLFWRLAADADVIVENYRQGVVDRLGIGYDEARKRRPDIVYASLNAYGHEGPWAGRPGHEQIAQAAAGMQERYGRGGKPVLQPFAVNDYGTGVMGAYAVALALLHRRRTGEGQHVVTSLAYTATALQSPYMNWYEGKTWDEPAGQDSLGAGPLQRLYRASDSWFYLGAAPSQAETLASVPGLSGVAGLEGRALETALEAAFRAKPAADWVSSLVSAGLGAHVALTVNDVFADPWVKSKGLVLSREHPGIGLVDSLGPTPRLSRTPAQPGRPTPQLGGDSAEIVRAAGQGHRLEELQTRRVVVTASA
jgi:crotonobetainyl-CoA:carnitine CoA-transferase CaiB-like acyl-CoA transferase